MFTPAMGLKAEHGPRGTHVCREVWAGPCTDTGKRAGRRDGRGGTCEEQAGGDMSQEKEQTNRSESPSRDQSQAAVLSPANQVMQSP